MRSLHIALHNVRLHGFVPMCVRIHPESWLVIVKGAPSIWEVLDHTGRHPEFEGAAVKEVSRLPRDELRIETDGPVFAAVLAQATDRPPDVRGS